MINLTRTKLFFLITIILTLIVVISLVLISRTRNRDEVQIAKKESQLLFDQTSSDVEDPKLAIFDELVIGKSTDDEIKQIAGLKKSEQVAKGLEYHFKSPLVDRDNIAVTNSGILVFKRFITLKDVNNWESPSVIAYKELYGNPELEKKGSVYYGSFDVLFLWASKGIAIIGNDFTDEVKEIHVFEPMSRENYLNQWGKDSAEYIEETVEDHREELAL